MILSRCSFSTFGGTWTPEKNVTHNRAMRNFRRAWMSVSLSRITGGLPVLGPNPNCDLLQRLGSAQLEAGALPWRSPILTDSSPLPPTQPKTPLPFTNKTNNIIFIQLNGGLLKMVTWKEAKGMAWDMARDTAAGPSQPHSCRRAVALTKGLF